MHNSSMRPLAAFWCLVVLYTMCISQCSSMDTRAEVDLKYINDRKGLLKHVIERNEDVGAKLDEYMMK
jgi:hypothetical protein